MSGAFALYSIPAPHPSSLALLAVVGLVSAVRAIVRARRR